MSAVDLPCGRLVAVDALVGEPRVENPVYGSDVGDLLGTMDHLGVDQAVVRHRHSLQIGPGYGNAALVAETAAEPRLLPAWFLTPDGREPHFDVCRTVDEMLRRGVRMAWTDAGAEGFTLRPWCAGPLYAALSDRRVPLILEYRRTPLDDLHEALTAYPDLRVILTALPRTGRHRQILPLLERHPGLHLCFSPLFSVHEGWRGLCDLYGPDRWVWGCDYPDVEPGAAVTALLYAGLTDEALRAVAHGTVDRLLAEVAR